MKPWTLAGIALALTPCLSADAQKPKQGRILAAPPAPSRPATRAGQTDWQKYARDRRWEEWQRARRDYKQDVQLEGDAINTPGSSTLNAPLPEDSASLPDANLGAGYDDEADGRFVDALRARDFALYRADAAAWKQAHAPYLRARDVAAFRATPAAPRLSAFDRYLLERDFALYRADKAAWQKAYRAAANRLGDRAPQKAESEARARYERDAAALLRASRPPISIKRLR